MDSFAATTTTVTIAEMSSDAKTKGQPIRGVPERSAEPGCASGRPESLKSTPPPDTSVAAVRLV